MTANSIKELTLIHKQQDQKGTNNSCILNSQTLNIISEYFNPVIFRPIKLSNNRLVTVQFTRMNQAWHISIELNRNGFFYDEPI